MQYSHGLREGDLDRSTCQGEDPLQMQSVAPHSIIRQLQLAPPQSSEDQQLPQPPQPRRYRPPPTPHRKASRQLQLQVPGYPRGGPPRPHHHRREFNVPSPPQPQTAAARAPPSSLHRQHQQRLPPTPQPARGGEPL